MGWAMLARGGVEVCPVPGEHTTLFREPWGEGLAAQIRAALDRAAGELPQDGPAQERDEN
jgi:hypothetical protein